MTLNLDAIRARAEQAAALPRTLSETTCLFWRETVLSWAESRLMPPQYDECVTALTQVTPTARALAADVLALLAENARLRAREEVLLVAISDLEALML